MKRWLRLLAHDIGIDLGTANTLVYARGSGIVIREPSVVAINKKTKQVLAIGSRAKAMIGRTPKGILAARPLVDGVVSDFEITEQMLRYFIKRVHEERFVAWQRPRVLVGIPSGVTEVEKRAVESAAASAGARKTLLVEEPMAAAVGCRMDVLAPKGQMIVDIGGGTTEVAVISLGGIVVSHSLRIAGDELTEAIVQFLRDDFSLQIGEQTAENIKLTIGTAYPSKKAKSMAVRGRDLISGMPKEVKIDSNQVRMILAKNLRTIVEAIKATLEETPPELLSDIMAGGVVLTGGGALLDKLDYLINTEIKLPVRLADDPLASVVNGTGLILEDLDSLKAILTSSELERKN